MTLAVLPLLNRGARMPMCGFIAYYGVGMEGPGPDHLPGFYRHDHVQGAGDQGFRRHLGRPEGPRRHRRLDAAKASSSSPEAVVEGIDAAPAAFATCSPATPSSANCSSRLAIRLDSGGESENSARHGNRNVTPPAAQHREPRSRPARRLGAPDLQHRRRLARRRAGRPAVHRPRRAISSHRRPAAAGQRARLRLDAGDARFRQGRSTRSPPIRSRPGWPSWSASAAATICG